MISKLSLLSFVSRAQQLDGVSKLSELESKLQTVFVRHGIDEEMAQAKEQAKNFVESLKDGDIHEKLTALEQIIDPVSEDLLYVSGNEFVSSMSQEAVEFYSDAASYWVTAGNLTAFNSRYWGTRVPQKFHPSNAVKCAAQKGKCECHADSIVYYGLKTSDNKLDTSVNYASAEADHSGYTFCKNQVFGDPIPGDKRKKYCFCDESVSLQDSQIFHCADQNGGCKCPVGGTIYYGISQ